MKDGFEIVHHREEKPCPFCEGDGDHDTAWNFHSSLSNGRNL